MRLFKFFAFVSVLFLFSCGRQGDVFNYDLLPVKMNDKWGYIDGKGKIIINPQFDEASLFSGKTALVKVDGLYGYIDTDGKYVINPMYIMATYFKKGMALVVTENGYPTFIDTKGEIQFSVNEADVCHLFSGGLAAYSNNGKWGYIDETGKIMINAQFDRAGDFKKGLANVGMDNNQKMQYGYINKKGEYQINLQFDEAYPFVDGLAMVKLNNKYGYIDDEGKFVINAQFDYASSFSDGLALVKSGDKYGFIDETGKIVINPQFDKVGSFSEGLALNVTNENKFGYVNKEGVFEINAQFDEAREFRKGLAPVMINDKYGFIDKEGKIVINPQFENIYDERFYMNFVNSDYFNAKTLETFFMDRTTESAFRGITKESDFDMVSNTVHSNDKLTESSNNSITVEINKDIDNYAKIETIKYNFVDKIYTVTPTYKFLYHWGNYQTGTRKDMNFKSKVKDIEIVLYLYGKASGKNDKMTKVLAQSFAEVLNAKSVDIDGGKMVDGTLMKVEFVAERKLLTGKLFVKVFFK